MRLFPRTWYQETFENTRIRGEFLGYTLMNDVKDSRLNPYNILGIPSSLYEGVLRLDFSLSISEIPLRIDFKPRAAANITAWEDGVFEYKGPETDGDAYINELLVTYGITQRLFLSAGRENLQWGPSYLYSPSNPFLGDNGKNNPYLELPGLDYIKSLWIISNGWVLLAHRQCGRRPLRACG